jgi:hypothetical protein
MDDDNVDDNDDDLSTERFVHVGADETVHEADDVSSKSSSPKLGA